MAFALTKWYLDAVAPDGRAAILYRATLRARDVSLDWNQMAVYTPGQAPVERSSLRPDTEPRCDGPRIFASNRHLGWAAEYDVTHAGREIDLLDTPEGTVSWACRAAAADVHFRHGNEVLDGAGYVERLEVTLPPWKLPIDEMRWGHWVSDDRAHSMVWIDWRGPRPSRWMLVDGAIADAGKDPYPSDAAKGDVVARCARGALTLAETRILHQRSVGAVARGINGLAQLIAHTPLNWTETKWLSRAALIGGGAARSVGWALHERVIMR